MKRLGLVLALLAGVAVVLRLRSPYRPPLPPGEDPLRVEYRYLGP